MRQIGQLRKFASLILGDTSLGRRIYYKVVPEIPAGMKREDALDDDLTLQLYFCSAQFSASGQKQEDQRKLLLSFPLGKRKDVTDDLINMGTVTALQLLKDQIEPVTQDGVVKVRRKNPELAKLANMTRKLTSHHYRPCLLLVTRWDEKGVLQSNTFNPGYVIPSLPTQSLHFPTLLIKAFQSTPGCKNYADLVVGCRLPHFDANNLFKSFVKYTVDRDTTIEEFRRYKVIALRSLLEEVGYNEQVGQVEVPSFNLSDLYLMRRPPKGAGINGLLVSGLTRQDVSYVHANLLADMHKTAKNLVENGYQRKEVLEAMRETYGDQVFKTGPKLGVYPLGTPADKNRNFFGGSDAQNTGAKVILAPLIQSWKCRLPFEMGVTTSGGCQEYKDYHCIKTDERPFDFVRETMDSVHNDTLVKSDIMMLLYHLQVKLWQKPTNAQEKVLYDAAVCVADYFCEQDAYPLTTTPSGCTRNKDLNPSGCFPTSAVNNLNTNLNQRAGLAMWSVKTRQPELWQAYLDSRNFGKELIRLSSNNDDSHATFAYEYYLKLFYPEQRRKVEEYVEEWKRIYLSTWPECLQGYDPNQPFEEFHMGPMPMLPQSDMYKELAAQANTKNFKDRSVSAWAICHLNEQYPCEVIEPLENRFVLSRQVLCHVKNKVTWFRSGEIIVEKIGKTASRDCSDVACASKVVSAMITGCMGSNLPLYNALKKTLFWLRQRNPDGFDGKLIRELDLEERNSHYKTGRERVDGRGFYEAAMKYEDLFLQFTGDVRTEIERKKMVQSVKLRPYVTSCVAYQDK